ncbi:MAG: deaminase [Cenarchaeum symbiont of Oopsacas minuta]|nr:deaminase [Cenarchaeum symbiont of Oopsacas minuta]
MVRSRPKVTLSAAISLDGKIASVCGDSKLSSMDDMKRVHRMRTIHDAILIGRRTAISDDPILTARHVRGKNPVRIIIDSRGTLPLSLRVVKTANSIPTIVATSSKITKLRRLKLESYGVHVMITGKNDISVQLLLYKLWKIKIKTILLEGGGRTNWEFINKGLVDNVVITISPYLLGGKTAPTLVDGVGFKYIAKSTKLVLKRAVRYGDEMVLNYSKLQVVYDDSK